MPHIKIAAEQLFYFMGVPITNTVLTTFIIVILMIIIGITFKKQISLIPGRLQNVLEIIIEKLLNLMEGIFGSQKEAKKYFPFIASIFLFILFSNWLGILPGIGSIGFLEKHDDKVTFVPFFRSGASDFNFTLALAIISIIAINIFGIIAIGFFKHFQKFFTFKSPINFFVGIFEFISEISKIISLSLRLFGNVLAGEILLVIITFLIPLAIPVPFLLLEIFIGFIQALVFAMLTAVFISFAVSYH